MPRAVLAALVSWIAGVLTVLNEPEMMMRLAAAFQVPPCRTNCDVNASEEASANKPIVNLADALANDPTLKGNRRIAVNSSSNRRRLPVVYIESTIRRNAERFNSLSGGYISPCKILTAWHGVDGETTVRISTETDGSGRAINLRDAIVEGQLEPGMAVDLAVVHHPSCEGGKIGFFKFVGLPAVAEEGEFESFLASFPLVKGTPYDAKTLAVTKCNGKYSRGGLLFVDCLAEPGSSGGIIAPVLTIHRSVRYRIVGTHLFLAHGLLTDRRVNGSAKECTDTTCNFAIDGGFIGGFARKIVEKDIEDYVTKMRGVRPSIP